MENQEDFTFGEEEAEKPAGLPMWKKALLGVALLLGLAGAGLYGIDAMQAEELPSSTPSSSQPGFTAQGGLGGHNLLPADGEEVPAAGEEPAVSVPGIQMNDWSMLLMKLGFSFVVGFAVGYAVAGMLKVTVFVLGVILVLLFGLQYAGLIDVNWHQFEPYYNNFTAWVAPHINGFKDFITSHLPGSSMAALGLVAGFKK